ncbi:hypothetical protein [Neorhizobium galegae]|uniref:hypothetical protein n=1 Tax=Neorhizobium galegae TaxID=399 RepID=UPI0006224C37|nr:hypothetical protein [Neorhizobium galegae]CDZ55103.1 Hypothetical protein NGAL_HAMBI2427_60040 [Neorhizobium galegae bv. orientalis]
MGTIWVKELVGGLDTRRMPETTSGGVLIKAENGHITRGGEFEKRAAFVDEIALPPATTALAATSTSLYVFGSATPPSMPVGVTYQRLQHPDGLALVRVLSVDLYAGKLYVVGEFADGSIYHFYNGTRVDDWFDGRSRATFEVTGGGITPAVAAHGSFEITGGTANVANQITAITIDGVSIISGAITHTGNNATTAAAVASAINSHTSVPDYTAIAAGQTVTVTAAVVGPAPNGKAIVITPTGDMTVGNNQNMAGGSATVTSKLSDLKVDGVSVVNTPVLWTTSNEDTAEAIAAAVNGFTSSPDYDATAVGANVNLIAVDPGTAPNGRVIAFTTDNGLTVSPTTGLTLAGGNSSNGAAASGTLTVTGGAAGNLLTALTVGGVAIISGNVVHTGNNDTTAAAIASAINSFASSPNYAAIASGNVVTITASDNGVQANGKVIDATTGGTFTVIEGAPLAGGVDDVFQPGTFVKTIGQKVYSVAGPMTHFSGLNEPTKWTTDYLGAGFIDMSAESSGSEELVALALYQNLVAIFAERVIQVWFFDPDPTLNRKTQVLNNTGTISPRSVTQFGDNDIFYLDESGLRSLKARDSSNAAATTDIGVPIDTLIVEQLRGLSDAERQSIIGLIEPRDGRFWLLAKNVIYVFSYFSGAKVSAWSTYVPTNAEGEAFEIEGAVVFNKRVYVRSGNSIYVYGGTGSTVEYDGTIAEAWLPYLDANDPTRKKNWQGVDAALKGEWEVRYGMEPNNIAAEDLIAVLSRTTYNDDRVPSLGGSTHISPRFRSKGDGYAKLSAVVVHYEGDANAD